MLSTKRAPLIVTEENVKYWTLTNGCEIRSSDCQSLNVRDMGLPL